MGDKKILLAGFVILGLGAARAWTSQEAATPALEGGIVAILLLGLLGAFSDKSAELAGRLALLVALTASIVEVPKILKNLGAT